MYLWLHSVVVALLSHLRYQATEWPLCFLAVNILLMTFLNTNNKNSCIMLGGVTDSPLLFFQQLAPFYMVTVCKMCQHTGMRTAPLLCTTLFSLQCLGKGKSVPLQAWSGPEGSRKLRSPDYVTMAQDGGKVVSLMHRPFLPPGNAPGTHFF